MNITLRGVSKRFGTKTVISPLDLTLPSRQFTTLLGPSGCGKTTLLRIIAGLETPDSGEIFLGDTLVFSKEKNINLPPEKRGLGFVFQDFALWPHLSVFENVAFGLRTRRDTDNLEQKVMEALDKVRLHEYHKRYPHQLSGGQQQRVAFARAIAYAPSCILFDEPLSALDALLREEMRVELRQLTDALSVTSVFVTHDQIEAMNLSDYIAVMQEGQVLQFDRPQAIYNKPQTRFVAQFVGKSNWLDANRMVRPEHLNLGDAGDPEALPMQVAALHYQGDGYLLTLKDEERTFTIFTRDPKPVGTQAMVSINRDNILTF